MIEHRNRLYDATRIGELLKHNRVLDEGALAAAVAAQRVTGGLPLGRILSDSGQVDQSTVDHFLGAQKLLRGIFDHGAEALVAARTRIGHLLQELGLVEPEQVESALAEQKSNGKALGEILIEQGQLSVQQLHDALHHQSVLRNVLLSAFVALITASITLPQLAEAASSSDSASVSITLRILPSRPMVDIARNPDAENPGSLDLYGATLRTDADGNYSVIPLEGLPSAAPANSIRFDLQEYPGRPTSGEMSIFVMPE